MYDDANWLLQAYPFQLPDNVNVLAASIYFTNSRSPCNQSLQL